MGTQGLQEPPHQLGVPALPAILDVEVHHRPLHVGKAEAQQALVPVFALGHDEDPVGPAQQIAVHGVVGEGCGAGRAHLETRIVLVEVLRGATAIDVRRADEQDPLPGQRAPPG